MNENRFKSWIKISLFSILQEDYFKGVFRMNLMYDDAFIGSHPIENEVITSNDALAMFDTIIYNKGNAVLKMLEGVVGEESMKQAMRVSA